MCVLRDHPPLHAGLTAYFEHDLDVALAAPAPHLYSLRYRLGRVERLLGVSLRRPSTIAALHIALLAEAGARTVLAADARTLEAALGGLERRLPELAPQLLAGEALTAEEPGLAPDLVACRLATGYPVPPASATRAIAARARAAGARVREGDAAKVWRRDGFAAGVEVEGERVGAGAVVVAAGP
jgi:glycine/D-amino acid oxidase-like deaminating enzyme